MGKKTQQRKPQLRARSTRSRGKPLSDPTTNTVQLDEQLRSLGLYAASTVGDGNCLFRALSDQLYGTDSFYRQVRQDVCDWIESHKDRYEPFVEDDRGLDTHLRCMRQNATYGGHMELSAFAHRNRRNVKVIQPGLVYVIEWDAGGWDNDPNQPADSPDLPPSSAVSSSGDRETRRPKRDKKRNNVSSSVLLPPPTESETVYVAYHDWEHFSSIRNLRGPHVGQPLIQESSASDQSPPSPIPPSPPRIRIKPSSSLSSSAATSTPSTTASSPAPQKLPRIKLKLPRPPPSSSSVSTSSIPERIPLPLSRSSSPFSSTSTLSSLSPSPEPPAVTPKAPHYRSPKRSFEQSNSSETSIAKRTRSSGLRKSETLDEDNLVKREEEDTLPVLSSSSATPGLSPSTSSSTPTSSTSSSPEPPLTRQRVTKVTRRSVGLEKPMTRRQRKALGLPKVTNRVRVVGSGTTPLGKDEWVRNGNGKVDVRGFRELKI